MDFKDHLKASGGPSAKASRFKEGVSWKAEDITDLSRLMGDKTWYLPSVISVFTSSFSFWSFTRRRAVCFLIPFKAFIFKILHFFQ